MKGAFIRVRDGGQTYTATLAGKRASCTSGFYQAALRVAEKVYGEGRFEVAFHSLDTSNSAKGTVYRYHVTRNTQGAR